MIITPRLELVAATLATVRAALAGRAALEAALGAAVPQSWPPEFLDEAALEYTIARLVDDPGQAEWWMYFVILRAGVARPVLIGSAGYKGPPGADGTVEIGYGIVAEQQRRGYGTEAARGMVAHAFAQARVMRVIAETMPDLNASLGVLRKCGFRFSGAGSEAGVVRYEITRAEYAANCQECPPAR